MKILMLSSGDRVPSARFRLHAFVRPLRARGHKVTILQSVPQKYDYWRWMGFRPSQCVKRTVRWWHSMRARAGRYDVVIFDREIFDADDTIAEERFRSICPRMVLDVDDAVFLRYPGKYEKLAAMSDAVVAGNRYLEEYTRPLNDNIRVIPTCVPISLYPEIDRARANVCPVIGWMGTPPNLRYLNVAAPALRELSRRHEFELLLIVPSLEYLDDEAFSGVKIRHEVWDKHREVDQLRASDIGIMPLFAEQEWDKYKCGLKLIQYMAIGLPGVASPVGVNSEIVEHGVNGFMASTEQDWFDILNRLLSDPALASRVGSAARQRVSDVYSIEANVEKLETVLAGDRPRDD